MKGRPLSTQYVLGHLLFAVFCLLPAQQVEAVVLTYDFEGRVEEISGNAASPFSIGQTLSGTISYDTATPPSSSGPTNAYYNGAITLLNASLNSYSLSGSPGDINIQNNNGALGDWISISVPVTGASLNGIHPVTFTAGLQDYTGLAIDGTGLGPLPPFSAFNPSTFTLHFEKDANLPGLPELLLLSGPITSITPVPVSSPVNETLPRVNFWPQVEPDMWRAASPLTRHGAVLRCNSATIPH